jgi:very-short-patch-repair endonuclease
MTEPRKRSTASSLRNNQTPAEQLLWSKLRSRGLSGFKFRRQHPIDHYILDFYCHEVRLGIEIDGGHHANEDISEKDKQRTAYLNEKGIHVIRFWNDDVLKHTDEVLAEIDANLKELEGKKQKNF